MGSIIAMIGGGVALGLVVLVTIIMMVLRRVVPTNMVHIVQSRRATTSYGKGRTAGNVYYEIPGFVPFFGVTQVELPESVFNVGLKDYEAYDQGRLPFRVDVMAFFRIADSDVAAHRVANFAELTEQLHAVLQGAVRTVLGQSQLETIMHDRSSLGERFTSEVDGQLKEWGVQTVKTIEFMDIRDSNGSKVIENIMAKEKSRIEKESRVAVAENHREAEEREIEARRQIDLAGQEAAQQVGERTAQQEQAVGIAKQRSEQQVLEESRTTAEKDYAVKQVEMTRAAEINRQVAEIKAQQDKAVAEVKAEQDKNVAVVDAEAVRERRRIEAEGEKNQTILIAEGNLEESIKEAQGIQARGLAEAEAVKAKGLAEVAPQMELAREIGGNTGYQTYLVSVEQVKANQVVGVAQAEAIKAADVKVIVNGGDVQTGIGKITDLFSSKGGQAIGSMLTGLAQTPEGQAIVTKAVGTLHPNETVVPAKRKPNGNGANA